MKSSSTYRSLACALLVALLGRGNVRAQSPPPRSPCEARAAGQSALRQSAATRGDSTAAMSSADTGSLAVVIYAAASAREVTFRSQPQLGVRLCGGLDSVHVIERRNLPNPVVAGTTYRDVYVAVQIFGRLAADCITRRLTGASPAADSASHANDLDCASLEVRGASAGRAPSDSTRLRTNPPTTLPRR